MVGCRHKCMICNLPVVLIGLPIGFPGLGNMKVLGSNDMHHPTLRFFFISPVWMFVDDVWGRLISL
jgi:hypothetical protein